MLTNAPAIERELLRRTELPGGLEFHHVEAGRGHPLVLLHGVLGDWRTWAPQWEALTPHFRTIAYSRRYNAPNRNQHVPSPDHSALVEAQDLAGLLPRWQAEPAILVGASYGAYTALAFALAHPQRVRALVLLEPPMLSWAEFSDEGRAERERFEREIRLPARAAFLAGQTERAVRLLTQGIAGNGAPVPLSEEAMRRRFENEASIRLLTLSSDEFPLLAPDAVRVLPVPTLLLRGERTPAVHRVVFDNLCAVMTQAQVATIPAAGHAAARDNPAAFNARVLDFLRALGLLHEAGAVARA